MNLGFSRQIFRKTLKYERNFVKIRRAGAWFFQTGGRVERQTDRHDEAYSRFLHI